MTTPRDDSLVAFRANFPSLERLSWFDTPGSPPGAKPVIEAVRLALDAWERGDFSWTEWDETPDLARQKLAALLGVDRRNIALVSSLSEAAATVADAVPSGGKVLVGSDEFRSNLLPWLALRERGVEVVAPEAGPVASLTERICDSIVDGVSLVAVSSAVSSTGVRPDLEAITQRARAVGARTFINVTQSFGVLAFDARKLEADYVAAHAYKWMLAPRGCAWLYVRPGLLPELRPIAPGWHSVDNPNQDYNGVRRLSLEARRLDGALPWLPWIGGNAALDLLLRLDPDLVQSHVLDLAGVVRVGLGELGVATEEIDQPSHIVRVYSSRSQEILRQLRSDGVIASGTDQGLRIGIHGFNTLTDVERFLASVDRVVRS